MNRQELIDALRQTLASRPHDALRRAALESFVAALEAEVEPDPDFMRFVGSVIRDEREGEGEP